MQLMQWVHEKEMKQWDIQLAKDSAEGKLDFLIREASEESGVLPRYSNLKITGS